ncbi:MULTISPECIES: Mo-dependent nitrogenase C-terminal domain-containing protein [Lyngbya]|uniref:Mo-dependent nitrogenase family protein n=1 Tax=Lyngbya aestuarii BL J TaxID=1348334 RepID=U7QDI9_9CYAN|nr:MULTISPECIES: Mo-dependent nitrogenase C-terminal domain-containing protein [Lyngbya]EAW37431.1 Mo-dependent nitrogenase-like protein [Lyngbya sp. PCC 8106]ERT05070.1 mo-dependent nitrogenase family protein [Lyngbya aestuarii BL J]
MNNTAINNTAYNNTTVNHQVTRLLNPLRQWLDSLEIQNQKLALLLYKAIPAQCPFEREFKIAGRTFLKIPPLCKLNPLYDQVVGLRFRAMCYLVDECGMSI